MKIQQVPANLGKKQKNNEKMKKKRDEFLARSVSDLSSVGKKAEFWPSRKCARQFLLEHLSGT